MPVFPFQLLDLAICRENGQNDAYFASRAGKIAGAGSSGKFAVQEI
jgi:hypothetical protein